MMRSALVGRYGAKVWHKLRPLYVSGQFNGDLTRLDEVAAPALAALPRDLAGQLRAEFWQALNSDDSPASDWAAKNRAMAHLQSSVDGLVAAHVSLAYDYDEIESRARKYAEICGRFSSLAVYPPAAARSARENGDHKIWHAKMLRLEEFFAAKRIAPPAVTRYGDERGRVRRSCSVRFWRRRLLVNYGRRAEHATRKSALVQRRRSIYISGLAFSAHRAKVAATERWLKACAAISDAGDQLSLWDVREHSQANPALRRAELMTRLRGFEEIADEAGHVGEFITLTCPSEYHATNVDGSPNPSYQGHTVRDAQDWLQKMWSRSRSKLKRKGVTIYGFRIAEPHHDATPHWHMVLFTMANHRRTLRRVLAGYWLSEGGRDRGAKDHRIKFKAIDREKGSAAGYLAKYVAKNIDGFEVGEDLETEPATVALNPNAPPEYAAMAAEDRARRRDAAQTSRRVQAWASLHGIRQFQQIGGPQVTIYRECRRMREPVAMPSIETARVAADSGEWADFIRCTGGIQAGRLGTLSLWSMISGECNQFDELRGPQIIGIRGAEGGINTHTKQWRIERCIQSSPASPAASSGSRSDFWSARCSPPGAAAGKGPWFPLGPVSITVPGAPAAGAPVSWSNPNETSMYGPA